MTRTAQTPDAATPDGEPEPERISGGHLVAKALGVGVPFVLAAKHADIGPVLPRARESGKPSLINVWVDPEVYALGTMNQTMYK